MSPRAPCSWCAERWTRLWRRPFHKGRRWASTASRTWEGKCSHGGHLKSTSLIRSCQKGGSCTIKVNQCRWPYPDNHRSSRWKRFHPRAPSRSRRWGECHSRCRASRIPSPRTCPAANKVRSRWAVHRTARTGSSAWIWDISYTSWHRWSCCSCSDAAEAFSLLFGTLPTATGEKTFLLFGEWITRFCFRSKVFRLSLEFHCSWAISAVAPGTLVSCRLDGCCLLKRICFVSRISI